MRTGGFGPEQCIGLDALEAMDETQRMACLLPVDVLLQGYARVTLDSENAARFLSGMRRRGSWPDAEQVAVYAAGSEALLGSARVQAGELIPVRLLSPLEISETLAQEQGLRKSLNESRETLALGA